MPKIEHRFDDFEGVTTTPDGSAIVLTGRSGGDEVRVAIPIDEVASLLVSVGLAAREAAEKAGKSKTRALRADAIELDGSKTFPDSLIINLISAKYGPFLAFLLPKDSFISFCAGGLSRFAPEQLINPTRFRDTPAH